ncbi:MAG: hypothetical protein AAF571_01515 [Verrucomicrobiota bacterium]
MTARAMIARGLWLVVLLAPGIQASEIVLKSGKVVEADQIKIQGDKLVIRSSIGGGTAEVPYPLKLVETIRFSLTAEEAELLESGGVKRLPELRELWNQRLPYLSMPESDSGWIGLRLAKLLVATKDQVNAEEALKIVKTVRERDWKDSRKQEAIGVRISALAASGQIEQAMQEADALESLSESDDLELAETRARSKFIQAGVAWAQFEQLEQEWPKWHLMPEKRKERVEYLNRALDHYLFPAIAHPELQALSAEGLVQAATIYIHLGKTERARVCLDEVINYFPDPAYVSRAQELKNTLNTEGNTS